MYRSLWDRAVGRDYEARKIFKDILILRLVACGGYTLPLKCSIVLQNILQITPRNGSKIGCFWGSFLRCELRCFGGQKSTPKVDIFVTKTATGTWTPNSSQKSGFFEGTFSCQKSTIFGLQNDPKISAKIEAKNAQKCAKWPKLRANALGLTVWAQFSELKFPYKKKI